jgi:hypothetical protein
MNQWNILKGVPAEPESVQEMIFERELTAQLQKRISKMSRSDRELLLSAQNEPSSRSRGR